MPRRALAWPALREAHVADHRALFDRLSLELPAGAGRGRLPTDRRIASRGGADPGLVELLFQYGRYLLIASSRPGTQPANLQGIWNDDVRAPWSSNYTININTQMNYWPAESANLAELHEPLLTFIGELAVTGARTARTMYGATRLDGAPQLRHLAALGHGRRLGQRRPGVGDVGDGRAVAGAAPLRALPVRRRPRLAARQGLSGPARRRRVRPRLAGRRRQGPPRHRAVDVAREPLPRTTASRARSRPARRWTWR